MALKKLGSTSRITNVLVTSVDLASDVTGTLAVGSGGTGQGSWTNGQIAIGNSSGNTLTKATLTAGTGITVTNGAGSITIANNLSTGVAGGQAAIGGTASGENLTLQSTGHVTKGKILFGTSAYDESLDFIGIGSTVPAFNFTLGGANTTATPRAMHISTTLNSSATADFRGISNAVSATPSGASLGAYYGSLDLPGVAGGSTPITTYAASLGRLNTSAGYTGTITTGISFWAQTPTLAGSQPISSYSHFLGAAITNGNGITLGTVNNYGINIGVATAGAGSGGTINNYGAYIGVPSGSGAGTTTNYGVRITGNGAGNVYALYSDSTAASYLAGKLTFGNAMDESKGADIASATTTDIGAATGNYVKITGTTTITGLGTAQAGTRRIVEFGGALTLTYNATSLILPTAANIVTTAGDIATFVSLGSGNWRCTNYSLFNGKPLASATGVYPGWAISLASGKPDYFPTNTVAVSGQDTSADTVTVTAHGWVTGTMVVSSATSGGLTSATKYYINAVSANTVSFHATLANAIAGTSKIDITGTVTANITAFGIQNTSIFILPFGHNIIELWNGAAWRQYTYSEIEKALGTLTSNIGYDVWGYVSNGALAVELLAWSSSTARATEWEWQDGRRTKVGDKTRLLLGSFYTISTTETEMSAGGALSQNGGKNFVFSAGINISNELRVYDFTNSWGYITNTIRQANGASGNKCEIFLGLAATVETNELGSIYSLSVGAAIHAGIGVDSITAFFGRIASLGETHSVGSIQTWSIFQAPKLSPGYHYISRLEQGSGAGTNTWLGDDGGITLSGLSVRVI